MRALPPGTSLLDVDPGASPNTAWVEASWRDPVAFWRGLVAFESQRSPLSAKSVPFLRYDPYHDFVLRHQASTAPACRWHDPVEGWRATSYPELARASDRLAARWLADGAEPGQTVLLAAAFGGDLAVGLVTCLRLGLVVSVLPPRGRRYLERRVPGLAPDWIASSRLHETTVEGLGPILFLDPGPGPEYPPAESTTWATGSIAGRLFSPLAEDPFAPVEVTADQLVLAPLRDGMFVHDLGPGDALGVAGIPFEQGQPSLLLAALSSGATCVDLPEDRVERLVDDLPLRSVGLTAAARDRLAAAGWRPRTPWGHWFRNAAEPLDWERWRGFVASAGLAAVPVSNVLLDPAAGGASLWSARKRGEIGNRVLPAAGVSWRLEDPARPGEAAPGDFGLLRPARVDGSEDPSAPFLLVSRAEGDWIHAGTARPRRSGWTYPEEAVEAAASTVRGVDGAFAVAVPSGGPAARFLWVLNLFVGCADVAAEEGRWRQEAAERIAQEVGPAHLPDRIDVVPLVPRRVEGAVDRDWCREQYLRGFLGKKSRDPLFRCLTRFRFVLCRTSS